MKIKIVLILLFITNFCGAQIEVKIFMPNFSSISRNLNDSTLVDRVKYNTNSIFFKFNINDTIKEFYFVNDSTYKYRELLDNRTLKNGQYKFIQSQSDTSFHYPPGQYEEEITYFLEGNLVKTGWWNEDEFNLSGRYWDGKKMGTWNQGSGKNKTEIDYSKKGEVLSILNPTKELLNKHMDWLSNPELKICVDSTTNEFLADKVEIVNNKCNCYQRNTSKKILLNQNQFQIRNKPKLKWELNESNFIFYKDKKKVEYKIWRLGRDRTILLKKSN